MQIAARAHLDGLRREHLVVAVHHHHDRHQRRAHAGLRDGDQFARAARAHVHQQHVDLVALERFEGVLQVHGVGEGDFGFASMLEQRAQQRDIG